MPEATINARDAPRKTVYLFTSLSAANSKVANCVLSPSSAMKTAINTVARTLKSINYTTLSLVKEWFMSVFGLVQYPDVVKSPFSYLQLWIRKDSGHVQSE